MARGLVVRPQVNSEALAPSTDRTFALLELLAQSPDGLSIAQITRELGVAQNSVFRITKTLEARGYLTRRDRDKCYLLTDKLLHIAQPKAGGKNLVEESLTVMKEQTITDKLVLDEHLVKVREQGYAVDRAEFIEGIHCVAAPIFSVEGEVAATICVSGPAHRIPVKSFGTRGRLVIEVADRISDRLRAS